MQPKTTKETHVYAKTMKEARERGYWFKAKEYGYGWMPVTWQGWLVTFFFTLLLLRDILLVLSDMSEYNGRYVLPYLVETIIPFILYTTIFLFLTIKAGEPAKWRWGNKK